MKLNYLLTITLATIVGLGSFVSFTKAADDPDETAVMSEFKRREENAGHLSIEDQLKVRAAQQKAMEDAGVKASLEQRDKAIVEFREKLRAAMVAADPSVKAILDKISEGTDPALRMGQ